MLHLRILEVLVHRDTLRRGNVGLSEACQGFVDRQFARRSFDTVEHRAGDRVLVGLAQDLVGPLGMAEGAERRCDLRRGDSRADEPTVAGADGADLRHLQVLRHLRFVIDEHAVGEQIGEVDIGGHVEHRDLDVITDAGPLAFVQRGDDRLCRHHPDELVDGVAGNQPRVFARARDRVGEPAPPLQHRVERGLRGERTVGAETGHEAAHEARIGGCEDVVGQAE